MADLTKASGAELQEMMTVTNDLAEFWKGQLGENLRGLMADVTMTYLEQVMRGDPHAFKGIECVQMIAKQLGDQILYTKALQAEVHRRFIRNGG